MSVDCSASLVPRPSRQSSRRSSNRPTRGCALSRARFFETIGTEASLPILLAAAARQGEGQVAAAADDALRGITERE